MEKIVKLDVLFSQKSNKCDNDKMLGCSSPCSPCSLKSFTQESANVSFTLLSHQV